MKKIGDFWKQILKIFEKMTKDTPFRQNFRCDNSEKNQIKNSRCDKS